MGRRVWLVVFWVCVFVFVCCCVIDSLNFFLNVIAYVFFFFFLCVCVCVCVCVLHTIGSGPHGYPFAPPPLSVALPSFGMPGATPSASPRPATYPPLSPSTHPAFSPDELASMDEEQLHALWESGHWPSMGTYQASTTGGSSSVFGWGTAAAGSQSFIFSIFFFFFIVLFTFVRVFVSGCVYACVRSLVAV
jgi:hypothetical protein